MADHLIVTEAGIAALVNAQKNGTRAVELSSVAFGTGKYQATEQQNALVEPFKTLTTLSGGWTGDNTIHVTVRDTDIETYTVYEVGLFTDEGVLFAVYSQDTPIIQKANNSTVMLSLDIVILAATEGDIVVKGDTNFWNPLATTEVVGVIEIATDEEAEQGEDSQRAVTPRQLKQLSVSLQAYCDALVTPDPEKLFLDIYGQSSGDIIGGIIVEGGAISPDPTDVFENALK